MAINQLRQQIDTIQFSPCPLPLEEFGRHMVENALDLKDGDHFWDLL
jgi:hypothetical protein